MVFLFIFFLTTIEACWDGFRTLRDFVDTNKDGGSYKYKKYDMIWHIMKYFLYATIFLGIGWFCYKSVDGYFDWGLYTQLCLYWVLFRTGLWFDLVFNYINRTNRPINYLSKDWMYDLLFPLFKDNTISWIWYFKFMATTISVVVLVVKF